MKAKDDAVGSITATTTTTTAAARKMMMEEHLWRIIIFLVEAGRYSWNGPTRSDRSQYFGFWAIQVNVILCEKRRGERKKRKRKERGRKGEKNEGKGLNQQQCIARHLYSMLSLLLPNNLL